MSFISSQSFSSIDYDHKEISLSKETDFKIETKTLDAWIFLNTNSNDMKFLSHIYSYMIYKIPKLQIQKSSNKGDMTKKPDLAQSFQKLIISQNISFSFEKLRIEVFYLQVSLQDLFTIDLDLDLKI